MAENKEVAIEDQVKDLTWASITEEDLKKIEKLPGNPVVTMLVGVTRQLLKDNEWYKAELAKK